jgi:hypothetical protein
LTFVYVGDGNTCCPGYWVPLMERWGLRVACCRLEEGRCPDCGRAVPGVCASRTVAEPSEIVPPLYPPRETESSRSVMG